MKAEFEHFQSAHCESGATANLLRNQGLPVSEAMAFGIGSGLFFVHFPYVKVMGLPITSYRSFPGGIFKKTCQRLQIPYEYKTFRSPEQGRLALDGHLSAGRPVGLRGNIYWLPYVPPAFRFQFNAHSFVAVGRTEDGQYTVSDPVMDVIYPCPARAMEKSRFARGVLSPKGLLYYPKPTGAPLPMERAIHQGLRETIHRMLYTPVPFFGIKGIRFLSRQMRKWPDQLRDLEKQKLYLANVVRMQEEIGTGGAGFRFLYAAFLQEAAELVQLPALSDASRDLTTAGNAWRDFATAAARFCKDKYTEPFERIADLLLEVADQEEKVFQDLRRRYLRRA